jgi:hypothetical protein
MEVDQTSEYRRIGSSWWTRSFAAVDPPFVVECPILRILALA